MKRISFIIASLALVFFVTGCGNNTSVNGDSESTTTNNKTGQFEGLIREETGLSASDHLRKYDGRPFYPEEIVEKVKALMSS